MKPEACRKCGCNVFETKRKGPHIGWYCTKCGAWVRWIPQNKFNEPKQMSIEDLSINVQKERNKPESSCIEDNLPWE